MGVTTQSYWGHNPKLLGSQPMILFMPLDRGKNRV
ncbi:uncharacterized protein G2W53_009674 [Senna tora]|uniref:Uncharacterized protein n=1 Tax=Senna tora TaxID=362788 RepID=A0A834WXX7_9FABA|nr:uncharacterized protein G2W53_009674 [Senna tora]